MTGNTHLFLGPAASGKTHYLLKHALELAGDLKAHLHIVVSSHVQVRAWKRRLAETGGALGVHVQTFGQLQSEILNAAGVYTVALSDPVQYRLLRTLVDAAPLNYYARLRGKPGFIAVLRDLIRELKVARISPPAFSQALDQLGAGPRLAELADLYRRYQERLQDESWADWAGQAWLAVEALERAPNLCSEWDFVAVDGFDDLTTLQVDLLRQLAGRVGELVITLTGAAESARPLVHRRFLRTQARLETALGIKAEPLPRSRGSDGPLQATREQVLIHLERTLFGPATPAIPSNDAVALIAAPDREGEVRVALRWLKARLVHDGMAPSDVALLARNLEPYRAFIHQTAAEFALPIHSLDGLPLRANPAVDALLTLLRLPLETPVGENTVAPAFPWRPTVETWRSPYFDWRASLALEMEDPAGITPENAEALDRAARWGSVIGGLEQWREIFNALAAAGPQEDVDSGDVNLPAGVPTGDAARALQAKFERFVQRLTPPQGAHPCRDFVAWIEGLVGNPDATGKATPLNADLGVLRCIEAGPAALFERDLAALNALKDVLRGLVWAEEAVHGNAAVH
ncbi:MAG: UvrD-helicase domain-containing protein, partial [Anaerolineae bacterium]|nr:UvrD-helicase domain-containing protein [Anaerolineae bacterium]